MKNLYIGQIVKNKLSTGAVVVVRIIATNVAGTEMFRVCDAREVLPDNYLISKNKTWAAPIENLSIDAETQAQTEKELAPMAHKDSLIHYKF